jgi:hypothetical protein
MNGWLLAFSESRGTHGRASQRLIQAGPKPEVADRARMRASLLTSSNTGWVGWQQKSTLGTATGVDVQRERGTAKPLSLAAVRPAQNEAGGSLVVEGTVLCAHGLSVCPVNRSLLDY